MASGTLLGFWEAWDCYLPTSNPASRDTRNGHRVLDFDASTDETAIFDYLLPPEYSGGGITVYIWWMATSDTNTAHLCRWQTAFERLQVGTTDLDSDSFATANSAGGLIPGNAGILQLTTIAHANGSEIDGLVAGEIFRLKLNRDADGTSGTDDVTGDAELRYLALFET